MKLNRKKSLGTTIVEMLPPIGLAGFMAMSLLPALGKAKGRANRIKCTSNLKQVSNALKAFAGENEDRMPWLQLARGRMRPQFAGDAIFNRNNFPTIAADLGNPKILLSPCDPAYKAANGRMDARLTNPDARGISYGIHHGGDELSPNTILNLTRNVAGQAPGNYYYPYAGRLVTPRGTIFASLPQAVDGVWQGNENQRFGMGGLQFNQGQLGTSDGAVMQLNNAGFGNRGTMNNRRQGGYNPQFNANLWRSHQ